MKFFSIKKKMMCFVLVMSALILAFCAFLGISNQAIFRQQSQLLAIQEYYDMLKDGFSAADSLLFSYAQSKESYTREECLSLLYDMDDAAQKLCAELNEPLFEDLQALTKGYTEAARAMLNQTFSGMEEALSQYYALSAKIDTVQMLLDTYTKTVNEDRNEKKAELELERIRLTRVMILGAFLMLVLFVYVLLWLSDGITRNLTALTACAEQICNGEWSISIPPDTAQSRDEVGVLTTAFYHMLETIQQQIEQLKKQEIWERQMKEAEVREAQMKTSLAHAQLLTLQSRVNPHFLFNALNVIAGQAAEESAFKTLDMISQTANYLRYSLSKLGKTVTLKEELQNAEDYLAIQKRRFGERLHYSIEMEPTCENARLPSMLLQPICENALIHGIMLKKEGGRINIRIRQQDDHILIAVEDNGLGFQPEQLQEVQKNLKETTCCDTEGIGLSSVIQRAAQFYGEPVQIHIESEPEIKTRVILALPYRKKEIEHDEGASGR